MFNSWNQSIKMPWFMVLSVHCTYFISSIVTFIISKRPMLLFWRIDSFYSVSLPRTWDHVFSWNLHRCSVLFCCPVFSCYCRCYFILYAGMLFFSHLVEDKTPGNLAGSLSYVEFLVHIHRQIQAKMAEWSLVTPSRQSFGTCGCHSTNPIWKWTMME